MTGVFDDFLPNLSRIGEEINSLQSKALTLDDAIREIACIIFSNSSLYYVVAKTIQGDKLVVNSAFCRDVHAAEIFIGNYKGTPIDRERPAGMDNFVAVNGQPRIVTDVEKKPILFSPFIFSDVYSEVVLPLKLSSTVIGVLSLASSEVIEEILPDKKDDTVIQLYTDALKLLVSTITQTLNTVENNE